MAPSDDPPRLALLSVHAGVLAHPWLAPYRGQEQQIRDAVTANMEGPPKPTGAPEGEADEPVECS